MSAEHVAPAASAESDTAALRGGGEVRPLALAVVTRRIAEVENLHALLPASDAASVVSWVRNGEGMVGLGRVWRAGTSGDGRMSDADAHWRALASASAVDDPVRVRGTGLVGFGSFAFHDDSPAGGALTVPALVIGRREGVSWLSVARAVPENSSSAQVLSALREEVDACTGGEPGPALLEDYAPITGLAEQPASVPAPRLLGEAPGALDERRFHEAVRQAVTHIDAGDVAKIVLSRSVRARLDGALDVRHVLRRLAADYPATWTFAVDGLVGATPELLVRRDKGLAAARVLAGTVPLDQRAGAEDRDTASLRVAEALAESSKDLAEHEFAVESLVRALEPYCASMNVPDQPFVLRLPNVMHLASDVTGAVRTVDGIAPSSLVLAEALHPTAAVGGTPTDRAVALIARIEGEDRGRYAGPVGWLGADGDGEWGIALRCGHVEQPDAVRLHAGCGIVAGSDPATEYAESEAKLAPMRGALR